MGFTINRVGGVGAWRRGLLVALAVSLLAASGGEYNIQIRELPAAADGQREQLVRRSAAKDSSLDILGLDVVWEAEFAEAAWIENWTGERRRQVEQDAVRAALDTATWKGQLVAAPFNSNTQLLWYRKDLVPRPPRTWVEMISQAEALARQGKPHYIEIQGASYEGYTVWVNAMIASAGGRILSDDGQQVVLGPPAAKGVSLIDQLARSPAADPSLGVQMENQNRLAFETGKAAFEINYPFVYPSAQADVPAFLMDEPLSNLDAKLRVQMRTTVARLQNQVGTTTVYVTHDQTEAMTLGDRVAVMRAGVIQQVGTPEELYQRPRNLFMAGFIGSPAMNFLPGTVEDGRLRTALGDVTLPAEIRARVLQAGAGRDLIVGIRPEHFEDAALLNGKRAEGLTFSAVVDVLESLGADKYAYFRLAGPRATAQELEELAADAGTGDAPGGIDQVVTRLDPASRAREGQRLQLWFDPHKLHLFNPDNGAHLTR